MARATGRASRFLPADQWPDWVLAFGRGIHGDEDVQAEIRAEWQDWRRRRDEWARDVPGFTPAAGLEERRRRSGLV